MSLFDCERQRAYFERTNQRLKTKISFDFQRRKIIQIRRIKEQISVMREISSHGLKVIEVERILSDLDIVSNVAFSMNATTSNEIVHALKIEQGSDFIESKQIEMNFIITNQVKRIEQLRDSIEILEENLRQTSKLNINYCISNDPSIVISSNLIHRQISTTYKKFYNSNITFTIQDEKKERSSLTVIESGKVEGLK
ncbi:unnamed protein product [Rotaria magnacalcarata]|uniref:Uncharacterized protein n=1 Tax=Rotaria magnacalcarata TaxID=392030 RepID=A0A819QPX6_9BILA|nr:unnamed protein product [Rotaria magnacalcarata]